MLYFIQGATIGLWASATPGPFLAFLLSQTLKNGWKRTLPASMAPLLSDGPIIALVLLVLTQTPDWFLDALQIIGGVFILYLAKGAFVALRNPGSALKISPEASHQSLLKATMVNVLNPNPYIFWSIVGGPIVIEGWRQSPGLGLGFIIGFYATLIGGFAGFIILFATADRLDRRISKILGSVSAVALLFFGCYQIWNGTSTLLG